MPEKVTKLPEGLREDPNLNNGIYIGTRQTSPSFECEIEPQNQELKLGGCRDPMPRSVFIDDKKGDVYVPTAEGDFLKYGKKDGLQNSFPFSWRFSFWRDKRVGLFSKAGYKYLLGGPKTLTPEEIGKLMFSRAGDDLSAYVLENAKTRKDIAKDANLIVVSARGWIESREKESRYDTLAREALADISRNPEIEDDLRFQAARALFSGSSRNLGRDMLLYFANDPGVELQYRYEALDFLKSYLDVSMEGDLVKNSFRDIVMDITSGARVRVLTYEILYENASKAENTKEKADLLDLANFLASHTHEDPLVRYELANWVYNWVTEEPKRRDEVFQTIVTLAQDPLIEPDARALAARSVYFVKPKERDRMWDILLSIAQDKNADSKTRSDSAWFCETNTEDPSRLGQVYETLLSIVKTQNAEVWARYHTAKDLVEKKMANSKLKLEALDSIFGLAKDPKESLNIRGYVARLVGEKDKRIEKKREALSILSDMIQKEEDYPDKGEDPYFVLVNAVDDKMRKEALGYFLKGFDSLAEGEENLLSRLPQEDLPQDQKLALALFLQKEADFSRQGERRLASLIANLRVGKEGLEKDSILTVSFTQ